MTPVFPYYNPAAQRRTRRLSLILCTLLIIACMALVNAVTPVPPPTSVAVSTPMPYLVKAHGNRLAIYISGESLPALVTEIDVRSLPQADREALARGVIAETDVALAKLLEDYDG